MPPGRMRGQRGQSLVESAMVIVMISLIFFGMMQVVLKLNAEDRKSVV